MSQLNRREFDYTVSYTMGLANSVDPENFEKFKQSVTQHAGSGILEIRNQHDLSIPRVAGSYGRLHILQWLIKEYPQVLAEGTSNPLSLLITIARYNFQSLQIEFGADPQVVQLLDKMNTYDLECSTTKGIIKTLQWIIDQYPAVLKGLGNDAYTVDYLNAVLKVVEAKDWIKKQQVSGDGQSITFNEFAGHFESSLSTSHLEKFKVIVNKLISLQENAAKSDYRFFVCPTMPGFVKELKQLQGDLEAGYEAKEKDVLRLIFIMTPFKNASWANLNPDRVRLVQSCFTEFSAMLDRADQSLNPEIANH